MQEFQRKDFAKILKHNGLEARRMMKESDSTVAHIYDRSLEGLDFTIELYGPYARIVDYGDRILSDDERIEVIDLVRRFLYIESDKIIYKVRKKRPNGEQHEKEDESLSVEVRENSHLFKTELLKYVDTGLFLDQAETRKSVEESSFGLKVLNLFSYTASFSVYAAAGGAERVDSVDLSNVYTAWARENLNNNGFFDESKYPTIAQDAETFVSDAVKARKRWDLIIFDPPSFSNSHKAHDFDLKKDYLYYLYNFTKLLSDGGVVLFSENLSSFTLEKNRLKAYYKIEEVTDGLRAFGFTKKKSPLRIFRLEKVKEFKGEVMKRIMDDESLERLSLGDEEPKRERKSRPAGRRAEHQEGRSYFRERRGGYRESEREYGRKPYRFDEKRSFDKRDSGERDYRKDFSERRDRRDDYRRTERRYGETSRNDYRGRDDGYPRRDRDDRRRRDFSERPEQGDFRKRPGRDFSDRPREERRPRERKAPVPYGYDEFRRTKGREDKKDEE